MRAPGLISGIFWEIMDPLLAPFWCPLGSFFLFFQASPFIKIFDVFWDSFGSDIASLVGVLFGSIAGSAVNAALHENIVHSS